MVRLLAIALLSLASSAVGELVSNEGKSRGRSLLAPPWEIRQQVVDSVPSLSTSISLRPMVDSDLSVSSINLKSEPSLSVASSEGILLSQDKEPESDITPIEVSLFSLACIEQM